MSDAQNWLRRSIDLWQEGPADPLRLAQTSDALALVDRLVGDYKASETLLRESLKRFELTGNSKSHLLSSLGDILREEGAFAEARSFLRKAENVPGASIGRLLEVQIAIAELDRDTKNWIASVDEWNRASAMAHDHGESGIEAACLRGL